MPENDTVDTKKRHGKSKKKKYRRVYTGGDKVRIFFGVLVAIALIVVGIHYIRRQFIANNEYDMEVTAVVTSVSKKYDKDEDEFDIVTLVKGKRVETFDDAVLLLPPAFYNIDLVLEKEKNSVGDNQVVPMTISTMSSGERQMLYTMSYVLYHLKNIHFLPKRSQR